MEEFPNFEKILAERVETKNEEIMVKLRADKRDRELRRQEELERKRLFEIEKKRFRKFYFENLIENCIDHAVSNRNAKTVDDFYQGIKYDKGVDFGKFFTQADVKTILDGLVKNGLLKRAHVVGGIKYSFVPRTLPDTE